MAVKLLTEKFLSLRRSMPMFQGYIVQPKYLPEQERAKYWKLWEKWAVEHPEHEEVWLKAHMNELSAKTSGLPDPG